MIKYEGREISDDEASKLIEKLEATIAWCAEELMLEGTYGQGNRKQHIISKMLSVSKRLDGALDGTFYLPR